MAFSTRMTEVRCHSPPREVFMLRAFSSFAIPSSVVMPVAWIWAITGIMFSAHCRARPWFTAEPTRRFIEVLRIAETDASGLCRLQGRFCTGGDGAGFFLGQRRENVQFERLGIRAVADEERHTALHQAGNEVDVAAKAVQAGNDQRGLALAAGGQGPRQFRTVRPFAGLDLDKLLKQLPAAAIEIVLNGLALRRNAEATGMLRLGADPQIRDKAPIHAPSPNLVTYPHEHIGM